MTTWKRISLSIAGVALFGCSQLAPADETGIGRDAETPFIPPADAEMEPASYSFWDELAEWFVVSETE